MQRRACGDDGVFADGDGRACVVFYFVGAVGEADEIAAEAGVGLDDDAPAEDDVRRSFYAGAAGDFVAGVLMGGVSAVLGISRSPARCISAA